MKTDRLTARKTMFLWAWVIVFPMAPFCAKSDAASPETPQPAAAAPESSPAQPATASAPSAVLVKPPARVALPADAWTPDLVPEIVVYDFRQEDVPDGAVAEWKSRGVKPQTAKGKATKLPEMGGVLFSAGTTEGLSWPKDNRGLWLNRWWVVIARADMAGVAKDVPAMTVNGAAGGSMRRQPYVRFAGGEGKLQCLLHSPAGPAVQQADCGKSFADWNLVVGFRRGGQYHAWINGAKQPPVPFTGMEPNRDADSLSGLGVNEVVKTLAANVAVDCAIVGQSELNDAQVDKLVGWAHWRAGRQDLLPADHPYKNAPPRGLDANDRPELFTFDLDAWTKWVDVCNKTKKAHRGDPAPPADDGKGNDYSVVFFDDFKADSVVDDLTGGPSEIWYCPTHLSGINVSAQAVRKSDKPSCYVHDPRGSGTMTLRMLDVGGRWRSGAFSSVNKEGLGRSWSKGRFRIRCKFPRLAAPRPGFFPAFWSYGTEHLFWRTRNRVEMDFFEYDGRNGAWINTTLHVHAAPIPYDIPEIRQSPDVRYKLDGRELVPKNNFDPKIDIYDGQYHVWEFRIEDDFSYLVVDDKEVVRVPTEKWLRTKKYIMVDWALRAKERPAVAGQTYDMTIDWIEVQQRERDLADVPRGFRARPALSGARGAGRTITCAPNVEASQIEYRWYKNGEPIVGATQASFTEDANSAGKSLRCHVRAVSLLNQPEAWTAEIKPAGAAAPAP